MTNEQLLVEVKQGLGIPVASTVFDAPLLTKIKAIKAFMGSAGVSDTVMAGDTAVDAIVIGVTDSWNVQGGEARFSALFHAYVAQLSAVSLPAETTI